MEEESLALLTKKFENWRKLEKIDFNALKMFSIKNALKF